MDGEEGDGEEPYSFRQMTEEMTRVKTRGIEE